MTLPHYLKELRLAIQEGWEKDLTTPKADIKSYEDFRKKQEKRGAGANVSDAKKFLQDSVGRPMGSGRTHTQPEPKTMSFR